MGPRVCRLSCEEHLRISSSHLNSIGEIDESPSTEVASPTGSNQLESEEEDYLSLPLGTLYWKCVDLQRLLRHAVCLSFQLIIPAQNAAAC